MIEIVTYILSGGALGFLIGLTGVGGGVLTVPVLISLIHLEPIMAVGTASFYAALTKIYALWRHNRQGTINWSNGVKFLVFATPGLLASSILVKLAKQNLSPEGSATLQDVVGYLVFGSIILSLAALCIDYRRFEMRFFSSLKGRIFVRICVFFIGAVMGATSVGGGILIIPALLIFYRAKARYVGTSIFVAVVLMIVMTAIYAFVGGDGKFGDVNYRVAGFMALGSLLGTHYGSALSKHLQPKHLQFTVVAVVILAGLMMIVNKFA